MRVVPNTRPDLSAAWFTPRECPDLATAVDIAIERAHRRGRRQQVKLGNSCGFYVWDVA